MLCVFKLIFVILLMNWPHVHLAETSSSVDCKRLRLKLKQQWNGKRALDIKYQLRPIENIIIHHTVTKNCKTFVDCAEILQSLQAFHMKEQDFDDIAYNFLIGNDGVVYEGRGWGVVGAHSYGNNANSTGIAFIGTYMEKAPTRVALNSAKRLLNCGLASGEISNKYRVFGANQLANTKSPGLALFNEIQKWPHWSIL